MSISTQASIIILAIFLANNSALATTISKIAFGSCLHQNNPQFIWNSIAQYQPDIFLFTGDNIYADTKKPNVMLKKYNKLANHQEYKNFVASTQVYATWDDHDYGANDAGSEYTQKKESQKLFQDFFNIPENSPSRKRDGIYDSHLFGEKENIIQLILLDTRYFRGPTIKKLPSIKCPRANHGQQTDKKVSLLGSQQWSWLAQQLSHPAALRIIVSSIQIIPTEHCWEKWSNFPHEREKLFNLLANTNANGVVFISGDRHLAEISKFQHKNISYPLYEITSSGMNTRIHGKGEVNSYRTAAENIQDNNFGLIEIDWAATPPKLKMNIINDVGKAVYSLPINLNDINSNQ